MNSNSKPTGRRSRGLILTQEAVDLLDQELRKWWENSDGRYRDKTGNLRGSPKKLSRDDKAERLGLDIKTVDSILRRQPVSESVLITAFTALNITPPFSIARHCVLASSSSGNLPYQPTPCIGRETQVTDITALLKSRNLVTLTGAGGVGKTRLAIAVAEEMKSYFSAGIWFVDLAGITDPAMVAQAVASALGVQVEKDQPLLKTLSRFLHGKPLLLLLDNCERLLDACAILVDHLLSSSSALRVLGTSRERLNLPFEHPYRVPSLPAPDPKMLPGKEKSLASLLLDYDAVRLFVARAGMHRADFRVTDQNAPLLASICHRLDGIPLAIELAAGRIGGMSLEDLERGLSNCFRILTHGSRAALPRHQTLRAAMDWSYYLLEEPEKTLLRRLSVFAGGCEREAVEQVCAGSGSEEWKVRDLLASLVDKNLVEYQEREGRSRYRLLETVRQYGQDRLEESGESEMLWGRHRAYFLALAEEAEPKLKMAEQREWMQRLEAEHANLQAALHGCLSQGQASAGLRFCGALCRFWGTRGYLTEGREWCAQALEASGGQEKTPERAKTLYGVGYLAYYQSDYGAARAYLEESLSLCEEIADWSVMAYSLIGLGLVASSIADTADARASYEQSRTIFEKIADRGGTARSLNGLASVAEAQGDYAAAQALYHESSVIFRKIGERASLANTLKNLGNVSHYLRDYDSARVYFEESRTISKEIADWIGIVYSLIGLGLVAHAQKDAPAAGRYYEESLLICQEIGHRSGVAYALVNQGNLAASQENYQKARASYSESLTLFREIGNRVYIAALLKAFAGLAALTGKTEQAIVLWGAAEALREKIGSLLTPHERAAYDHEVADARRTLDEAAFSASWARGHCMTLEQAIEYALKET